jgi:hypothetical protein
MSETTPFAVSGSNCVTPATGALSGVTLAEAETMNTTLQNSESLQADCWLGDYSAVATATGWTTSVATQMCNGGWFTNETGTTDLTFCYVNGPLAVVGSSSATTFLASYCNQAANAFSTQCNPNTGGWCASATNMPSCAGGLTSSCMSSFTSACETWVNTIAASTDSEYGSTLAGDGDQVVANYCTGSNITNETFCGCYITYTAIGSDSNASDAVLNALNGNPNCCAPCDAAGAYKYTALRAAGSACEIDACITGLTISNDGTITGNITADSECTQYISSGSGTGVSTSPPSGGGNGGSSSSDQIIMIVGGIVILGLVLFIAYKAFAKPVSRNGMVQVNKQVMVSGRNSLGRIVPVERIEKVLVPAPQFRQ